MTNILIIFLILYFTTAMLLLWLSSFTDKLTLKDYRDAIFWLPILIKLLRT